MSNNGTADININGQNILSDAAVLGTLGAIVGLLAIAIGIGTWQCMKRHKSSGRSFSRLRSSQRLSTLSGQSTLSQEQFCRLLQLYHGSDSSVVERIPRQVTQGVLNERSYSHASEGKLPDRSFSSQKPLLGSTRSSLPALPSPERLRTASDSTPVSNIHMSGKRLDVNISPQFFQDDFDVSISEEIPRGSNFVRSVGTRNRHGVAYRPPPRCYGRSVSVTRTMPHKKNVSISNSPFPLQDSNVSMEEPKGESLSPEPDVADQKPFYFAWPEEAEEEAEGAIFSPLLLKASVESLRDGMNVGDEAILSPKIEIKDAVDCHHVKSTSSSSGTSGSIPSSTHLTDKGVVTSKHIVLPYGLKSTWV